MYKPQLGEDVCITDNSKELVPRINKTQSDLWEKKNNPRGKIQVQKHYRGKKYPKSTYESYY